MEWGDRVRALDDDTTEMIRRYAGLTERDSAEILGIRKRSFPIPLLFDPANANEFLNEIKAARIYSTEGWEHWRSKFYRQANGFSVLERRMKERKDDYETTQERKRRILGHFSTSLEEMYDRVFDTIMSPRELEEKRNLWYDILVIRYWISVQESQMRSLNQKEEYEMWPAWTAFQMRNSAYRPINY